MTASVFIFVLFMFSPNKVTSSALIMSSCIQFSSSSTFIGRSQWRTLKQTWRATTEVASCELSSAYQGFCLVGAGVGPTSHLQVCASIYPREHRLASRLFVRFGSELIRLNELIMLS
jgi:hypothetical protein